MLVGGDAIPVAAHQGNVGETGKDGANQTYQHKLVDRGLFCHDHAKLHEIGHLNKPIVMKTKNSYLMLTLFLMKPRPAHASWGFRMI